MPVTAVTFVCIVEPVLITRGGDATEGLDIPSPDPLVAVTVNIYVRSTVKGRDVVPTVMGDDVAVPVRVVPPSEDVAVTV
jgi:hypothetical protein